MSDTFWSILYVVGGVVLGAWARRADWRTRATAGPAMLDLLGSVCLAVPALAWLDANVAAYCSGPLLCVLFVVGVLSLAWFLRADMRTATANPAVAPEMRRRYALGLLVLALLMISPDVLWGALALAHAART